MIFLGKKYQKNEEEKTCYFSFYFSIHRKYTPLDPY